MEPWDDRGQSIQIGAVLIFGALILLLSLYQATVVPEQNEQVEFDHSQQVQGELLDLRNAVVSTVGDAGRQSVSIQLGTTYPPRFLAVNPPPVSGQLRTVETADGDIAFGVTNATALDGETDDFWDGGRLDYDTGGVVYRPNYNEYGQPPSTVYENSVLYDDFSFEGTTIARSDQGLVDGSTLTLVALNGSLGRSSSGSTAVDVRPVSASTTTVAVTNRDPNSNVTLRVPTQLSESTWEDLLAAEFVDAGGNVTDLRTKSIAGHPDYRMLVVDLVPGTYELRMAKAGVGTRVTDTSAAYVTEVSGENASVPEAGSQQVVVEVRDAYNNPVAGIDVTGSVDAGRLASRTATTGDDGRAAFRFEAPTVTDATNVSVNVSYAVDPGSVSDFDGREPENAAVTVRVQNTQVDGAGGGGGGSAPYALTWDSPAVSEGGAYLSDCDAAGCTWDVGRDSDSALDISAVVEDALAGTGGSAVEGVAVDFSLNDSAVATLSADSAVSDANGEVETALSAAANGTVRVYAVSGGASDTLNVTVTNVSSGSGSTGPATAFRVDDFADRNGNAPFFVASYDASGANSSFERVEVSFDAADGNPSGTRQSTDKRGSVSYQPGFGDGEQFDVTLDVIYTDAQGDEYVAATETITDTADARNPTSQNADLSESGSASLTSYSAEDRTNSRSNSVRYRFDYIVDSGSYSQVRLFVLNLNSNGATATQVETSRNRQNVDINPGFGANTQYRIGIAVYDADGAIVDVVDTTDTANGDGTVLTTSLALLGIAIAGHALRRTSMW